MYLPPWIAPLMVKIWEIHIGIALITFKAGFIL